MDEKHTYKVPEEQIEVTTVAVVDGVYSLGEYSVRAKKGETVTFRGPASKIYGHGLRIHTDAK